MNHTARLVLKLVAAGLAFAALVCLIVGSWQEMVHGCSTLRQRIFGKKSEYDDYADEEIYNG